MNKSILKHLKEKLDSLKPWEATEKMDKAEAVEWSFLEGYKYRKALDLGSMYGHTNSIKKLTSEVLPEIIYDEAAHLTAEQWDEIHRLINKNPNLDKMWVAQKIEENKNWMVQASNRTLGKFPDSDPQDHDYNCHKMFEEREINLIKHGGLVAKNETCPKCLNNPKTEQAFSMNEISMKLYDAKYRSVIDEDQLFKLLDYFEEKTNGEN